MPYRRNPQMFRRYLHSETTQKSGDTANIKYDADTPEKLQGIPMPNESEDAPGPDCSPPKVGRPSFLDFIKSRIHIEELILLGLIFLLFEEGIDDDLFLILLIYILLA